MSTRKKQRSRRKSSFKFEPFLINYGLQTAGILLILGALLYLAFSNFDTHTLAAFLNSLSKPSAEKGFISTNNIGSNLAGYLSILFLAPGVLLLLVQHFWKQTGVQLKATLVSLGFIGLILGLGKIFLDIRQHHIQLNYHLVLFIIGLLQVFVTGIAMVRKSRFALNWTVLYFIFSVFLLRLIYGVLLPNLVFLIVLQIAVSVYCFRSGWITPFAILMTFSSVYLTYYFIKLVLIPGPATTQAAFLLPAIFTWFILSVTGFGILRPVTNNRVTLFIWNYLPYIVLAIILGLCLGFYALAGINYWYLAYYTAAVFVVISLVIINRKYDFIKFRDPFFITTGIFTAFLLPQLYYLSFFLILAACLSVAFLAIVYLTDLKISFQLSVAFFVATLGFYLASWVFTIIPALLTQSSTGMGYPVQIVTSSVLLFTLSLYYYRLFARTFKQYAFAFMQAQNYKIAVGFVFYTIAYLCGYLLFDYLLVQILPVYRVNLVEWVLFTYAYLYFLIAEQNIRSRSKIRYILILAVFAIILYPAVLHPETVFLRTIYMAGDKWALLPFLMHYLCLGIYLFILLNVNKRIGILYPKNRMLNNIRALAGIAIFCFVVLTEYDHIFLLSMSQAGNQPVYEMLIFNKFIPYSIILMCISISILVFSIIKYSRFLRRLSMLMIFAVLLKVLFIDITILSVNMSILLLVSLGAILLAFSFLIPWLRKQSQTTETTDSNTRKEHHKAH